MLIPGALAIVLSKAAVQMMVGDDKFIRVS